MATNPWDSDPIVQPTQARGGQVFSLPKPVDPEAALNHQMKVLQLQKMMKDAQKEQVGDREVEALARLYVANKRVPPTRMNDVEEKAVARAQEIDPNYDPELAANRLQAIKDFSGAGKASQAVAAANRLAENLQELKSISDKMGGPNLHVKALNHVVAGVEQQGEPELVSRYNALLPEIANQFDLIMKSNKGSPTVSGTEEVLKGLAPARSLAERDAAFQEVAKAVHGAIAPIKDQWNSAYGGTRAPPMWISKSAGDFFSSIDPEHSDDYGGNEWRGLPGLKGVGDQPTLPPPPAGGTTPPPGSPPPAGPQLTPASGATRTQVYQSDVDKKVASMLAGGVPAAQIKKFVADSGQDYGGKLDSILAWRAVNPTYKGTYDVHSENIVPTTLAQRAAASPLSALPYGIANAATMGGLDEVKGAVNTLKNGGSLSDNIAAANLEKQTIANANPGLDLTGNIIGGAATMIGGGLGAKALLSAGEKGGLARNLLAYGLKNPIKTAALGDAAYGAGYGAGENNDNRALGAGIGGVTGLIASPIGAGASKAVGSALTGVVNPAVQRLQAAGIPLTVGEVLGGGAKKAQDALTSVFGPGSMVMRRYNDGRRALNQAFFNEAGNVIGTPIDKVGQEGVQALDAAKSQAYSDALDPVRLNLNTPDFINPMKGIKAGASEIPAGDLPQGYAANAIDRFVGNNVLPDGTMSGRDFQKAYRGLARTANATSGKVEGYDIGQALGQAKDVLSGTLADQNPQAYQGFLAANRANRMLNIIATAQKAAKNQISDGGEVLATPAQFGAAATNNAVKYSGDIAAASGSRPFNQLINDSQQVMSSKLPTSGTVERALVTGLATGGAASLPGIGYETGGGTGAEIGAGIPLALTLLGTKKGQQLLTAALLKRTVADQLAGRAIGRNPQIGAGLLASAGIPLLDSPSP